MKKTHLLTQPTRVQDINYDDFEDGSTSQAMARVERSRVRSYRRLRHQEL